MLVHQRLRNSRRTEKRLVMVRVQIEIGSLVVFIIVRRKHFLTAVEAVFLWKDQEKRKTINAGPTVHKMR